MNSVIITTAVNSPDFILLQRALALKFCSHPFRFVVVNDCKPVGDNTNFFNDKLWLDVEEVCRRHDISHVRLPQELHRRRENVFPAAFRPSADDPASRAALAVQWALNEVGFQDFNFVMILDSDMFPIRVFSLEQMLGGNEIAGVWQERAGGGIFWRKRVRYLWNGILVVNAGVLPDKQNFSLECGRVDGVPTDVGGHLHHYFARNPDVRVQSIHHLSSGHWGRQDEPEWLPEAVRDFVRNDAKNVDGRYYAEIYDDRFFHFRAGGNWDGMDISLFAARQAALIDALKRLV